MKIGHLEIGMGLMAAPIAGVTGLPFRKIAHRLGADVVCTEMISSTALARSPKQAASHLPGGGEVRPVSAQIFGSQPEEMAKAAATISERGVDLIDINMGCPVKKVTRSNAGAALLRDLPRAAAIVRLVVRAASLPVTLKYRSGWDASSLCAVEVARMAEEEGVAAVILHPRTKTQGFGGRANWDHIRQVKERVSIPVIGNGDIRTPEDAAAMLRQTKCDGIMIGRAAMGDPWIFERIRTFLSTGVKPPKPDPGQILEILREHFEAEVAISGARRAVFRMRKFAAWYSRGLEGSALFRREINHVSSDADFRQRLQEYFGGLIEKDLVRPS
jgi:tRNA-dihydrouridine synthase B